MSVIDAQSSDEQLSFNADTAMPRAWSFWLKPKMGPGDSERRSRHCTNLKPVKPCWQGVHEDLERGQRALNLNQGFVFGCEGAGGLGGTEIGGGKRRSCLVSFHWGSCWFAAPSRPAVCPWLFSKRNVTESSSGNSRFLAVLRTHPDSW